MLSLHVCAKPRHQLSLITPRTGSLSTLRKPYPFPFVLLYCHDLVRPFVRYPISFLQIIEDIGPVWHKQDEAQWRRASNHPRPAERIREER